MTSRARKTRRILATVALAAGSSAVGVATGQAATLPPVSTTFAYTGAMQSYLVPSGICALTIVAQGGAGYSYGDLGGAGAVITATVPVPPGDRLSVLVGGAGTGNGGGLGGGGGGDNPGGGASVVASSAPAPLVVAGGGGGAAYPSPGGDGGAIGATAGGAYSFGGQANGIGGISSAGSSLQVGGGGGGVNGGGGAAGGGNEFQQSSSGAGGGGNGVAGGGGGSGGTSFGVDGGTAGQRGQIGGGGFSVSGSTNPSGGTGTSPGGNGANGSDGGGGGGIGFGGGGGGEGGGGGGWGGGAGGGGGNGGGGGSSHVIDGATAVSSSTGTGNGLVAISYDPSTDTCPGTPGAATGVTATGAIGAASVGFTTPTSDGGSAISSYQVSATDLDHPGHGGQTAIGAASPITVYGLYPGEDYTFTVTATNATGPGLASQPSPAVTTAGAPDAPTGVTATVGSAAGSAQVSFTAPVSDGGAPITGYTVIATDSSSTEPGGQGRSGLSSPLTVTGLTPGDSYTFTVTATNLTGVGRPSDSSNAIIPTSAPDLTFTSAPSANFSVGAAGSIRVTATGGSDIQYAEIGTLPDGVTFSDTGLLSGTPRHTAAGSYPLTVVAVSSNAITTQDFALVVTPRASRH